MRTQIETIIDVQLTNRNRLTAFFRWVIIAPVAMFVAAFSPMAHWGLSAGGVVVFPVLLALLFRGVYPSYALNFNHAILELNTRLTAYALLLTDDFPSIEKNPKITILLPAVENGAKLNRGLVLIKWILAIPLYVVGMIYSLIAAVSTVLAWISVSLTGSYPAWAIKIVLGTISFWNRVLGYAVLFVTDEYPPFSL